MQDRGEPARLPLIVALGDRWLLVRFSDRITESASQAVASLARHTEIAELPGVEEVTPNLVSVLVRYDPRTIGFDTIAGEIRLLLATLPVGDFTPTQHTIDVRFGGEEGPDLDEAAQALGMESGELIAAHLKARLRVLATGFAPGFVYCGLHAETLHLPRRATVRASVPPGSILFAAGQTAITATPVPTGWHVIGHTAFRNFDPDAMPPTRLVAGDIVRFREA